MAFFEKVLEGKVMSTSLLIRANVTKRVLYEAYKIATDFEARYSAYKEDSFLSKINQNSGLKRIECSKEDKELFFSCIECSKKSDGLFDITMGALSHGAYHFGFANEKLASADEISSLKKLVDYKMIDINDEGIYLQKKGMRLDLGGIGKGYVAKKVAQYLLQNRATKLLVNVGGEIVTQGKSYRLSVKDPFSEKNMAHISTSNEATSISTSGDYERFINSREHHHILDKKSGCSANGYSSMTLLQNGLNIDFLDAYATAMFSATPSALNKFSHKHSFSSITINKEGERNFINMDVTNLKAVDIL